MNNLIQVCPCCKTQFDWNDKESCYQVNDYFEMIFCSYSCSAIYSLKYIRDEFESLNIEEIKEISETF